MIIGGIDPFFKHEPSSMQPEIWKLDNSAYKIIQPIGVYSDGVALFEVDANFCKKNTGKSLRLHVSCDFDKYRPLVTQFNVWFSTRTVF